MTPYMWSLALATNVFLTSAIAWFWLTRPLPLPAFSTRHPLDRHYFVGGVGRSCMHCGIKMVDWHVDGGPCGRDAITYPGAMI